MNRYPSWLNILVLCVVLLAGFFALPSIYGESRAVQITRDSADPLPSDMGGIVLKQLTDAGETISDVFMHNDRLYVLASGDDQQERIKNMLTDRFGGKDSGYKVATNFAPLMPAWLRNFGGKAVHLGLDLRGGVHLLFEVDMPRAISQYLDQMASAIKVQARNEKIPGVRVRAQDGTIQITTRDQSRCEETRKVIDDMDEGFVIREGNLSGGCPTLLLTMSETQVKDRQNFAIEQNTTTLRSRLDQLGVAEPLVQRQGANRIVVQLPGVGDPAEVIEILSAVATLEFRGECLNGSVIEAARSGRAPAGCLLLEDTKDDIPSPAVLDRDVIATGGELVDARFTYDAEDGPIVNVKLDGSASKRMFEHTKANLNKRMAVVFIETTARSVEGQEKPVLETSEKVINFATIRGTFSDSFRISGFTPNEAQELAVLLRAGALAAPIYVVEQRTVGPTLGKDNIVKGERAVAIGFLLVVVFMFVYYRLFGLFANLALFANIVIMMALLSLLQASLTLPGIAGIVLTVGMAVDANVLIFERIREELRAGALPQNAIHAGYDKAFSSIADANITTLIAALVLYLFGTGPIQGFATTLAIGILSSMFTAIIGTRALVNWVYGGDKKVEKLSI
ncbi:MAG: protein translocase subunit SecD [Gammaproteobacteria bacterium]